MISSCFFLIKNGSLPFCVDAEVEYEYNWSSTDVKRQEETFFFLHANGKSTEIIPHIEAPKTNNI